MARGRAFGWVGTIVVVVLMILMLPAVSNASGASVHAAPMTEPLPVFYSSAMAVRALNESITYVASVSEPCNWTLTGTGLTLTSDPLSTQAVVRGGPATAGTESVSLVATNAAGGVAYQNWTLTTVADPFIVGLPAFSLVTGQSYSYTPTTTQTGGTWSFIGAPYFTFNTGTAALTSSDVSAGTYTNVITYTVGAKVFSQAWVTTTSALPQNVIFTCSSGDATEIIGVGDGLAAGCGTIGAFTGQYVLYTSATINGFLTEFAGNISASTRTITVNTNLTNPSLVFYAYGFPGNSSTMNVNGVNINTTTVGSGGFYTFTSIPAPISGGSAAVLGFNFGGVILLVLMAGGVVVLWLAIRYTIRIS